MVEVRGGVRRQGKLQGVPAYQAVSGGEVRDASSRSGQNRSQHKEGIGMIDGFKSITSLWNSFKHWFWTSTTRSLCTPLATTLLFPTSKGMYSVVSRPHQPLPTTPVSSSCSSYFCSCFCSFSFSFPSVLRMASPARTWVLFCRPFGCGASEDPRQRRWGRCQCARAAEFLQQWSIW